MTTKKMSRVQIKNRNAIMDAALDVFSMHGFRGATLDQIAERAGMFKPNIIYYFPNKEAIFVALLNRHMDQWLAPLRDIDPDGDALDQILIYVDRKVQMSRDMPRESRLFATEIMQGAPRMTDSLSHDLKSLFDDTVRIFETWMAAGKIATVPADHLIFSIWATTQHYADFDAQIAILAHHPDAVIDEAQVFLRGLYTKLLTPPA